MSGAKAFINASYEDLGISPIEALASGTPVIGYAKGGLLETTTENKSAVYFTEQKAQAIVDAADIFDNTILDKAELLRKSVEIFDQKHFRTNFKEAVNKCLAD
jgi:glycosyltransferase involved in cell wall biosynthesis